MLDSASDTEARPARRPRRIYGYVYELALKGQSPDEHDYVGMAKNMTTRMRGHRSAASVAKDPWKARILPGVDGYRILEYVWATGDDAEDARTLRRAEAYWIDRLRPTRNEIRPIRPRANQAPLPGQPTRRTSRPLPRLTVAQIRARRRARRRTVGAAMLLLTFLTLFTRAALAGDATGPAAWVLVAVLSATATWVTFWFIIGSIRRFMRGMR